MLLCISLVRALLVAPDMLFFNTSFCDQLRFK